MTIKAEYGPFMTRQTVPTQYIVPDLSEKAPYTPSKMLKSGRQNLGAQDLSSYNTPSVITDFKPHQMDLSAHLVTKEVKRIRV